MIFFCVSFQFLSCFISAIANVTYELCGTELIALLHEANEIKRLFPQYNQAQKFDRSNYILTDYTDQKGVHHIIFTKNHKNLIPLLRFKSFDAAREYMFKLISDFELCAKCCGIHTGAAPCMDHLNGKCKGVCIGKEDLQSYNARVVMALESIQKRLSTRLIIDEGREYDERSVVLIDSGIYKGFGYFSSNEQVKTADDAYKFIQPYKHNPDIQRILDGNV